MCTDSGPASPGSLFSESTPMSPGGHGTTMAADIREFAEALVTLGDLRYSGLLTDEEFNQQKQRLLAR
jgi:hypothetical protein